MDAKVSVFFCVMVFAAIFIPSASATTVYNCTAGYLTTNTTAWIDGIYTELYYDNTSCPGALGCATSGLLCNSPENVDPGIYLAIGVTLALVALVFAYIAVSMGKKHFALQMLFLAITILTLILDVAILLGAFTNTQNAIYSIFVNQYTILVWAFVFFMAYIFIIVVIESLTKLASVKKENKRPRR